MPQMLIEVAHSLHQDEALTRVKQRIEVAKVDSRIGKVTDIKEHWETPDRLKFAFKVYGFAVAGVLESLPNQVIIDFDLPFAAMMIKGMIESQVTDELAQVLA